MHLPRWTFTPIVAIAVLTLSSCTLSQPSAVEPPPDSASADQGVASPAPAAAPSPQAADPWAIALNQASSAVSIAQSARSAEDWQLVTRRWEQAIASLRQVPQSHAQFKQVASTIQTYEQNRAAAERQIAAPHRVPADSLLTPIAGLPDTPAPRPRPEATPTPLPSPAGTAPSSKVALAQHLRQTGAKVYGTYWCPACSHQKQQFGDEAFQYVTYIECDPRGQNARPDLCRQANITAFPTWEMNGRLIQSGSYPLEALAHFSGYAGDRNFGP
jgi:hypothetical protein